MPVRLDLSQTQPLFNVAATRRIEQAAADQLPPHALMQRAGLALRLSVVKLTPVK